MIYLHTSHVYRNVLRQLCVSFICQRKVHRKKAEGCRSPMPTVSLTLDVSEVVTFEGNTCVADADELFCASLGSFAEDVCISLLLSCYDRYGTRKNHKHPACLERS